MTFNNRAVMKTASQDVALCEVTLLCHKNTGISQCFRSGRAELAHLVGRNEARTQTDRACTQSQEEEPAAVSTSRLDAHTYCSVAVHT